MGDRWPQPLLIEADGQALLPERVSVGSPPFDETRLQEILENHPELLPVEHFDVLYGPPLCIGREVPTGAGRIDNLYISPNGYLTVVETKLWKSPEARRQVVAQIIDYTKHLAKWDYTDLGDVFGKYAAARGLAQKRVYEYVSEQSDDAPGEVEFYDAVGRCLRNARFLLLIVGDGIRENVEDLVAYLQQTPNLQFTLGLVEMSCYRVKREGEATSLLMVPRVVAKTAEITRAIVQIKMSKEASTEVEASTTIPASPPEGGGTSPLTKEEFFDLLTKAVGSENAAKTRSFLDGLIERHELLKEHFTPKRLSLKVQLPEAEVWPQTLLEIVADGWVRTGARLFKIFVQQGYPRSIMEDFYLGLGKIDAKAAPVKQLDGSYRVPKGPGSAALKNVVSKFPQLQELIDDFLAKVETAIPDKT